MDLALSLKIPAKYFATAFAASPKFKCFCRVAEFQAEQTLPGFLAVSPVTQFQYNRLETVGSGVLEKNLMFQLSQKIKQNFQTLKLETEIYVAHKFRWSLLFKHAFSGAITE